MDFNTNDPKLYHSRDISKGLIRTGYYSKAKGYMNPVSISRVTKGDIPELRELAPPSAVMNRYKYVDHDEKAYAKAYTEHLDSVDWKTVCMKVSKAIRTIGPVTLLCFEKPGDFCHRHAAAARLCSEMLKAGLIREDEISDPDEDTETKDVQMSLF